MRDFPNTGYQDEREALVERIKGTGFYPEVSIGDGWMPIVIDADQKLAALDPQYQIHQIKEKFGALRFYYDGSNFDGKYDDPNSLYGMAEAIVREAESASAITCEFCGAPGTAGGKHWIKTLCPTHHEERNDA